MKSMPLAAAAAAVLMTCLATAAEPWTVRVGAHAIDPKSDNGTLAGGNGEVDGAFGPTFNLGYQFTPALALDVLAALPFEHDISINGSKVATAKELPPTVSLQYRFLPGAKLQPFVAAGVNYTTFMDEELVGGGGDLKLEDSWGIALQAGVDYALTPDWVIGADLRYIRLRTDASVNGTPIGTAEVDPLAYGVTLGRRF